MSSEQQSSEQQPTSEQPRNDQRGPRNDQRGPRNDQRGPRNDQRGPRNDQRGPRPERDERQGPPPAIPAFEFVTGGEDFAALLEASAQTISQGFKVGEKVKAIVSHVDSAGIYIDVKSKSEGLLFPEEFIKAGLEMPKVGDELEAWFVSDDGSEMRFTVRMSGEALANSLEDALANKVPVEGKVEAERKGGYTILIAGQNAFCPGSQIDSRPGEASQYVGKVLPFLITQIKGNDMVVSRRALLDKEAEGRREQLKETLSEGDEVEGIVRKIEKFGVFVDLGGADGMIPNSELSWKRNFDASSIVSVGEKINVVVRSIDWDAKRISLSFRSAAQNPWTHAPELAGQTLEGTVSKADEKLGLFIEVAEGLEGLLHISKLPKGKKPADLYSAGDKITVTVEKVDAEARRISLVPAVDGASLGSSAAAAPEAGPVSGKVDGIKPFGVFIELADGRRGLMHVSVLNIPAKSDVQRWLGEHYPQGKTVEVEIQKIDGGKVSLCPVGGNKDAQGGSEAVAALAVERKKAASFGSLNDAFAGMKF